jgi:hypothetical protein
LLKSCGGSSNYTSFLPNWHIDLLCEHLEAVTAEQITRLVNNIPPRYADARVPQNEARAHCQQGQTTRDQQ